MKVLIPDGVADEIHEREVPDSGLAGITGWKKLVRKAHALDAQIIGLGPLDKCNRRYARADGVFALWGDFDGCGHYVGCVIGPEKKAHLIAKFLLSQWRRT